jgi:hypothetical protein
LYVFHEFSFLKRVIFLNPAFYMQIAGHYLNHAKEQNRSIFRTLAASCLNSLWK